MIKETLLGLGLTSNEVEIYLTLLNKRELSVNKIGSKSGLHRQVCYDALDRLVEKGFVAYVTKKKKKFFKALNPQRIIDFLDEKKHELELKKQSVNTVLPQLRGLFNTEREETEVELIKGKMVFRTIYNDIFNTLKRTKQPLLAIGIDEESYKKIDEVALKQYFSRLRRHHLKEKVITKESATLFFEGPQTEYRLIPDKFFSLNTTHIYGNKVAILIGGTPLYGILIKSKQVADANRKYFEMLWKMAKKRKK